MSDVPELLPPEGADDGSLWWLTYPLTGICKSGPYMWSGSDKIWRRGAGWISAEAAAFIGWTIHAPADPDDATERARLEGEVARLREALSTTLASLVAATSLLERGGKKAAPSDKMFAVMLEDYRKATDVGREALRHDR